MNRPTTNLLIIRDPDNLPQNRINLTHNQKRLRNSHQNRTIPPHIFMAQHLTPPIPQPLLTHLIRADFVFPYLYRHISEMLCGIDPDFIILISDFCDNAIPFSLKPMTCRDLHVFQEMPIYQTLPQCCKCAELVNVFT